MSVTYTIEYPRIPVNSSYKILDQFKFYSIKLVLPFTKLSFYSSYNLTPVSVYVNAIQLTLCVCAYFFVIFKVPFRLCLKKAMLLLVRLINSLFIVFAYNKYG